MLPLLVAEAETRSAERWLREDPAVVVWTLTRVELLSALARRRRDEPRSARALAAARREVLRAWDRWTEIAPVDAVRRHAERLVETHPLRAADAVQIAAAIVAAEERPDTLEFLSFDERQMAAADLEGFRVLRPGEG